MLCEVLGEETVCPECGDAFRMNVDIGDGHIYDVCLGCGYKRKKSVDGGTKTQVQEST